MGSGRGAVDAVGLEDGEGPELVNGGELGGPKVEELCPLSPRGVDRWIVLQSSGATVFLP